MDPIAWISLAGLILSTIAGVDQAVGSGLSHARNTEVAQAANQLARDIAKDQAFLESMRDAYNRRDAEYLQGLINSSPFGRRFAKIKDKYLENQSNIKKNAEQIRNLQVGSAKAQSEMNSKMNKSQTTGSAIVDLVSGAATVDTSKPKYESLGGDYVKEKKL